MKTAGFRKGNQRFKLIARCLQGIWCVWLESDLQNLVCINNVHVEKNLDWGFVLRPDNLKVGKYNKMFFWGGRMLRLE